MNGWRDRRRHPWLGLAGLLLLFLACAPASAGNDPWAPFDKPWFDQVSISDGLPHSITTAVAQDRAGLVWIGTMGGLVRYDGYRMQVFEARNGTMPGLPDAYVRSLLALPDGSLLIGTNAGGLARFDPADNSFHVYPVSSKGLSDRKIYAMSEDHAGGVWIATDDGLDHLDLRTDTVSQVDTGKEAAPRNFSVREDSAGNLWLGNNRGLFVRRAGSQTFVRATSSDKLAALVLDDQIWAIREDREGRLWAGSVQTGAAYRDTDGHWHGVPGFSGYPGGARQATVRDFLETRTGIMWIATDGRGVIEYSPANAQVRMVAHDPAVPSSLPGDSVRALLQDRSGNIWAATDLGIARNNPNARTAFSLLPSPLEPNALADTNIHSIFVDTRGRIWLGLGAGHIDMIDLRAGNMHHLQLDGSQTQRDVRSLTEVADGSIWVGTQGLARIDPDTLAIEDSILPALHDKPVLSLQPDGERVLIGTYDGLYRYDLRTHALDHAEHRSNDPASLASDTVRQIAKVGKAWWYGTTRGISVASDDSVPHDFINLRHRADDHASLPQEYIGSITTDPKGRVWVSTFGGLAVLDPQAGDRWHFQTIGAAQGLSSDKVTAALPDDHGQLWASLSNGMASIDGDTHVVHALGTRDGLHIGSYVNIAAARAPGGELLFGGLGGLTVIRPDWQPPAVAAAPLAITHAIVGGVPLAFGKLPGSGASIRLDQRNHNLRMDFALLDYQAPMETSYSYRMDGLDDDWTEIPKGSLPSAIYTNLPHGDYRLHLRALTHGMRPHTIETSIGITVTPLWHETLLSRIVAVLLLIGLIGVLVHLRTLYLRRQARQLQRQISEHTRELLAANQRLDELASTDGLTGVYNRRRFLELARDERERAQGKPTCMALFDLDRFKLINDTHGHLAGDAVIRGAIEVIRRHCRQHDLIGRYGGEEFVLCLPDTSLQHAQEIVERICTALAQTTMHHDGRPITVTASIGIAALRAGESIEQWLSRADKALYEAKRRGRNCCAAAP